MEKNDQNDQNFKEKIPNANTSKDKNIFFSLNRKRQILNHCNKPLDRSFPSHQFKLDTLQLFMNSPAI